MKPLTLQPTTQSHDSETLIEFWLESLVAEALEGNIQDPYHYEFIESMTDRLSRGQTFTDKQLAFLAQLYEDYTSGTD